MTSIGPILNPCRRCGTETGSSPDYLFNNKFCRNCFILVRGCYVEQSKYEIKLPGDNGCKCSACLNVLME